MAGQGRADIDPKNLGRVLIEVALYEGKIILHGCFQT